MMKYIVKYTAQFKKEYQLARKRGRDMTKIKMVIDILASGGVLPAEYKDHTLIGNFKGTRECHITSDWLLLYKIFDNELILLLSRTGTHSDLY